MARHVVIEHVAHIRNVEPARGDVGGHKEGNRPIAEARECPHPVRLVEVAVDRLGVQAVLLQGLGDDIDVDLAVAKDDRVAEGIALGGDRGAQHVALHLRLSVAAWRFEFDQTLLDRVGRGRLPFHLDLLGVREEGIGDPLDLGRHGGGEEKRLARKGHEAKNSFDIRDEAHIEHPVGFVHDHDFHVVQDQLAAFEMVEQAAGRGDQHVNTLVDGCFLFLKRNAADQQRLGKLHVFGVDVEVLGHLRGKFTGRAKHQRARHPRARAATGQHGDHWQGEGSGLASAGLGDAQNVATLEGGRNRAGLNGSRGFVTRLRDGFLYFGI
mmetsp:Transcript_7374/g.12914  ORF Transcript_7374/g.12914 Transcript_7374/m.12914 type:complete len:324 (+) Transcript_7374:363-1334(+)